MSDPEYWKKLYEGKWEAGSRRVKTVGELIQSYGYEVDTHGFMADSDIYSKDSPVEKGIPDLEVTKNKKRICLLEVTGTEKMSGSGIWVRPDKFEYAANHTEDDCWLGHIEESSGLIRFLKLEKPDQYETIYPTIRGTRETYKTIPEDSPNLIEPEKFKEYLDLKSGN